MKIAKIEEEHHLIFNEIEWKQLLTRKPVSRPVAWSAGWFRLEVKLTKIKDPFEK